MVDPQPADGQSVQVQIDDSKAVAGYVNFCRVTGTPDEVVLDVGLNMQPYGPPTGPIPVSQRLIMNYYTAKRLLALLQVTVQRHEAAFGNLEMDIQKRIKTPAAAPRK